MKRKINLEDVEIIKGLANGNKKVIDYLYDHYFTDIFLFVKKNSGNLNDAEDVFQDALLLIYQKVIHEKVVMHNGFQIYLFVVCKHIWIRKLNRQKNYKRILNEISVSGINLENIESSIEKVEKKKLYLDHIDLLSERCKEMIRLSESGKSLEEIAKILNIESVHYTKKVKYKCKERLIRSIKSDPRFYELSNDI